MSAPNRRLQDILARIKPFNELHKSHQTDILGWKNQFREYDQNLRDCLVILGVQELEPYLAWIPFDKLDEFHQLAEGGFAKVYMARIYLRDRRVDYTAAAKELKTSMITEVRLLDYTRCLYISELSLIVLYFIIP